MHLHYCCSHHNTSFSCFVAESNSGVIDNKKHRFNKETLHDLLLVAIVVKHCSIGSINMTQYAILNQENSLQY